MTPPDSIICSLTCAMVARALPALAADSTPPAQQDTRPHGDRTHAATQTRNHLGKQVGEMTASDPQL
jgi:hypothetical protein